MVVVNDEPNADSVFDLGPMAKLNSDVLANIFLINTELGNHGHNRLNTARSASQVCRQWRGVILTFPLVWSRLVDLDHLHIKTNNHARDQWREEVLKRAGEMDLWVQGSINSWTQDFVFSFLDAHWARIERLDIWEGVFRKEEAKGWDRFELYAPRLRAFNLICDSKKPELLPLLVQNGCLFKNGAPFLKELCVPGLRFDLASCPWVAGIRKITLSHPFTIREIFGIIKEAKNLECLEINGKAGKGRQLNPFFEIYSRHDLPQEILLPRLQELTLRGHFTVVLPFLERMSFESSCWINLHLKEEFDWMARRKDRTRDGQEVRAEKLQILQRQLSILVKRNLLVHQIKAISIHCEDDFLRFSAHTDMERSSTVSVSGNFGQGSGPVILEQILLSGGLTRVREMILSVTLQDSPSSMSFLGHMTSALPSLKVLQSSENNLKFLLANIKSGDRMFASLDTIKLSQLNTPSSPNVISTFCHRQLIEGSPINYIDLTTIPYRELHDLDYLDELPELKTVKWMVPNKETVEYRCGSGRPEIIQFRTKRLFHLAQGQGELKDSEHAAKLDCILCIWDGHDQYSQNDTA